MISFLTYLKTPFTFLPPYLLALFPVNVNVNERIEEKLLQQKLNFTSIKDRT